MQARYGAVLVLLSAFALSELTAQKPGTGCTLLSASEISGVVGQAPGKATESDMVVPSGPQKGETTVGCTWDVGNKGMISAYMIRAPQGAQREEGLAVLSRAFATLRAQGWTEKKESFSTGWCSMWTPPASQKDLPVATGCIGEQKGIGFSVGYLAGDAVPLPIDKMKKLFDKAAAHLP